MKRRKQEANEVRAVCQLRDGSCHPFGALRSYMPMGCGEEEIYREIREGIPVLDAAVGKLVRLSGGFSVSCRDPQAQQKVNEFLRTVSCGRGQIGINSFLSGYLDSLLTYGRAIGEMVVVGGKLRAVCWADVTTLRIEEGDSPLDCVIWGPDEQGRLRPLPYQQLLLFTTLNPEPKNPYGVSIFRGMPFLADILMKIYQTVGINWERAGNIRYSVICKGDENMDPVTAQQLVAKTGLPPFLLGLNWSTTERMSTQQADILTSELWALRRTVEPIVEKICRTYLALEGMDNRVQVEWDDISLQDITEEAQADLYRAQAEKARAYAGK